MATNVRFIALFLSLSFHFGSCNQSAKALSVQADSEKQKAASVLAKIQEGGGWQMILVTGSSLRIETSAIQEIVDLGPDILDVLVAIMKDKSISFDSFARCYSASDQIVSRLHPEARIRWRGNATFKHVDNFARVFPLGQSDELEFRNEVVADLESKLAEIRKKRPSCEETPARLQATPRFRWNHCRPARVFQRFR